MSEIIISGLRQNNLKNISLTVPKERIVVFTGVSGSGKSSIVFDTIAAESQRQLNATYPPFVRSRLPKHSRPEVDLIENLTAAVIVDQTPLGGNARSTVGTITGLHPSLRLLFSRAGTPNVGSASHFSFNDPNGMCPTCSGLGKTTKIDIEILLDPEKSWQQGCINDTSFRPGTWYWKQYAKAGFFDVDKAVKNFTAEEYNLLLYGTRTGDGEPENPKLPGIVNKYEQALLHRDLDNKSSHTRGKAEQLIKQELCPTCQGQRLNQLALSSLINGHSIADMCAMELTELRQVLASITGTTLDTLISVLQQGIDRMIGIGLPYLHLDRESPTLSGGEAQRLKLVRYMGSALTGMTYIFDEPSTGMHPRDVHRMNSLLTHLRDKGNTVLVVEHDKDVISIADHIIDIGPGAGRGGGQIVFTGTYPELLESKTLTGEALRHSPGIKEKLRQPTGQLSIKNATLHNLKNLSVDIPLGVMTVVTGVAGSGKSTLITQVFAPQYADQVMVIDQSPITATSRSTPASFLGFLDHIRQLFAVQSGADKGLFSFNSLGACENCQGKGVTVIELAFMDPIVTECEACEGSRYNDTALNIRYQDKNIVEVLGMSVEEALVFFDTPKIVRHLRRLQQVGLEYLSIGQSLATLSGGERQRIKLAKNLQKKGNIIILDEPTTGLHPSDVEKLLALFEVILRKGNSLVVIEHNLDVVKQADWIIDIGPDGGKNGGQLVFQGTPRDMLSAQTLTADSLRSQVAGNE